MNLLKTIILVIITSSLFSSAQSPTVKARLKKIGEEFKALPETKRVEYLKYREKAFKAVQSGKYLTCLIKINDAQVIFQNDLDLIFLNGVCHAEIQDIDKAIEYYQKILAINPHHINTLMNLVEINYFAGRYEETVKYTHLINSMIESRANGQRMPLLDFKLLISLTKLSKANPEKYQAELDKIRAKYTFMDDTPFYYYANALESFDAGDKQEGLIWILKAYLIFKTPAMIEIWNKSLVDTGYIGAHEIMFNKQEPE